MNRGSLRILIVDDDPIQTLLVEELLADLGVTSVTVAQDGELGLAAVSCIGGFDCIVCDLRMPRMDGLEFLRHLGARSPGAAVILSSGSDPRVLQSSEFLAEAHRLRVLGVMKKPISRLALEQALSGLAVAGAAPAKTACHEISKDELQEGLAAGRIETVFQPKIDLRSKRPTGVEALARFRHPTRGLLSPDTFLAVAEAHDLIDGVTDAVVEQAFAWGAAWRRDGLDLTVAINLSMDSLIALKLPERLAARADAHGLDADDVVVEVTETRVMKDPSAAVEILARLRIKGFHLAIDDFGTGFSSLQQLKQLPFDELKIDRSFVSGCSQNAESRAILEASVDLARKLELLLVGEGVESPADLAFLSDLGVDQVQGYAIARPMPGDEIAPWCRDRARRSQAL